MREAALDHLLRVFFRAGDMDTTYWTYLLSLEGQEQFLEGIVARIQLAPSTAYTHAYFRGLVKFLEQSKREIHENVYGIAAGPPTSSPSQTDIVLRTHYLGEGLTHPITLFESTKMISEGTTGLQSWKASIALSRWLLKNPKKMKNRSIIELGAGTGLCSLAIAYYLEPKRVTITDHSPRALDFCQKSMDMMTMLKHVPDKDIKDIVELKHLDFADAVALDPCPDVVIATDVTFDHDLIDALVDFLKKNPQVRFYVVHTIRKYETFEYLCDQFKRNFVNLDVDQISTLFPQGVYGDQCPASLLTNDN